MKFLRLENDYRWDKLRREWCHCPPTVILGIQQQLAQNLYFQAALFNSLIYFELVLHGIMFRFQNSRFIQS